ncbi:MAG: hypothetical protein IAF58_04045 [Leptolyngbya sp.]|nr:hypothetical protein [Candidatus Melainabacteria bacterium]
MYADVKYEKLEKEFEESFERELYSYSWGFFAYDDTSTKAGGGAGNFSWFDKKEGLVQFLQKFPLLAHSLGTADAELFEKAKDFLSSVTTDSLDQRVIDELNQLLRGVEQIQWFGQLSDLLSGETEFAQGLRKFYSSSTEPLSKTHIPEFAEFLRNWGH